MSVTRGLVTGELHGSLVRRTKNSDGSLFGIATIRDRDRMEVRFWTVFFNELALIERVEKLRPGEPISVSGPFYAVSSGERIEYRITAYEVIDTHWKKKTKKQIRQEEKQFSDEFDHAPREEKREFDDEIPVL